MRAVFQPQGAGVLARHPQRSLRDIHAQPARPGTLGQQAEQDAARSGAQIEQAFKGQIEAGTDENLGFRPGVKHLPGDLEVAPEEGPPPGDLRHRLAGGAGGNGGLEAGAGPGGQLLGKHQRQTAAIDLQRMGQQDAGIARGLLDPGRAQPRHRLAQRFRPGHASISASLPAWSSAIRASITSSRSPAIT